ncbi:hypothetical protein WOLCODRAFT_25095 [Wolfiporia cocos MD-104 SS10]|uniref:Uncharacterized protein n=1 Tax=Wolfiporia cocos (strain MD-104) TaxID=742152 RepID=A0A2H3JKK5_WOLCO|nr:hypothetical protein WOLCODRAFT_25095 [Wolfiporia cocos MD-104 SS10]
MPTPQPGVWETRFAQLPAFADRTLAKLLVLRLLGSQKLNVSHLPIREPIPTPATTSPTADETTTSRSVYSRLTSPKSPLSVSPADFRAFRHPPNPPDRRPRG